MPLYEDAEDRIRYNLEKISANERAPMIEIGFLTDVQFTTLNARREFFDLHLLEQNEIIFIGRHLFDSRSRDGYSIDDMIDQVVSALSVSSEVSISANWSRIENRIARLDRYGNMVNDRGVFEMSNRKPRAELYSVMPKGDTIKPLNTKKPT